MELHHRRRSPPGKKRIIQDRPRVPPICLPKSVRAHRHNDPELIQGNVDHPGLDEPRQTGDRAPVARLRRETAHSGPVYGGLRRSAG